MLHVLVHMGLLGGRETSETIARMLNTNPVVVRRMMAALKEARIVDSEGGRGGGWTLLRPLSDVTILDVQQALERGPILRAGTTRDHPTCPVEMITNKALSAAFEMAEEVIRDEFSRLTLAHLARRALAADDTVRTAAS